TGSTRRANPGSSTRRSCRCRSSTGWSGPRAWSRWRPCCAAPTPPSSPSCSRAPSDDRSVVSVERERPDPGAPVVVDVVMPARNEARTVAANVAAAIGCRHVRRVIVVDDGSTDDTARIAEQAGARVVGRPGSTGSKAHAMDAGVQATDATHILFVDADCTGLTSAHLDAICEPVLDG